MKKYNIINYNRHKKDLAEVTKLIPKQLEDYKLIRDDLVVKYMPLVENLARKFATSQQASGCLDITDLMQYGYIGLINSVDKINVEIIEHSASPEKTIKSFISKRVKGAIRRAININRGDMKIPEYVLNELRGLNLEEHEYDPRVALFFNQLFVSTDAWVASNDTEAFNPYDRPDNSEPYNIEILNKYLLGIMKQYLSGSQYHVLRLSFGLDVPKMSAVDIASFLDMNMATASVRVSQIKKEAIDKLIMEVDPDLIFDLV
jgi:RNA polymerase sigma factor (sigma-70 family)